MSNAIDIVVKKEAVDGVTQLLGVLTQVDDLILKVSSDALKFNQNLSSIKTPADLSAQTTRNKASVDSMNAAMKVTDDIEKQLVVTTEKLAAANSANAKELAKLRVELANTNKETKKQAQDALGLINSYDKLSQELIDLRREAKATAVTFGIESEQFKKQAVAVQELDGKLKKIDQTLGQSQRNVGNYGSGYNALGTSISRLSQELPNLGQSAQIFALSIGNNFGQLKDAVDGLIAQNKILQAEGKPTVNIFKQIFSQVFSLNTLFYVAIALFVTFGKEIGEFTSKLFSGSKGLNAYTESTKALSEATKEATKNSAQELNALQANLAIAKNANLPLKEREIAYKNLNDQYPFYFENLTKEQVLAGETAAAERALTDAIIARAKANAIVAKITENQGKIVDLEQERIDLQNELTEAIRQNNAAVKQSIGDRSRGDAAGLRSLQTTKNISTVQKELLKNQQAINELNRFSDRLTAAALVNQEKAIGLDYKKEKSGKETKRAKVEEIDTNLKAAESTKGLIEQLELFIKELEAEQRLITTTKEQFDEYQKTIDRVKFSIQGLTTGYNALKNGSKEFTDEFTRQTKGAENLKKSIAILREETNAYLETFSKDFVSNGALSALTTFFDGSFQKRLAGALDEFGNPDNLKQAQVYFQTIVEFAQQAYNLISEASQKNFDAEYERLESQKNIAIAFAGESDVAKAEIERQAEQRRREIEKREQKVKQEAAIVNTVINTAQAVVSALATANNIYAGIALAAFAAATGAAQIAIIKSQKVSAYWQGGTHEGGLMRVNDDPMRVKGSNYKEVVKTPDGIIHRPQGRDVLMNAPRGTEIYKDEDAFKKSLDVMLNDAGVAPIREYEGRQSIVVAQQPAFTQAHVNQIVSAIHAIPVAENYIEDGDFKFAIKKSNTRQEIMNGRATQTGKTTRG